MADKGSKTEVEELENVDTAQTDTAQTDTAQKDTAPAEAPTEYDATKDIMMNITLYKKLDGEKYKIYIHGNITVTKPDKAKEEILVPDKNRLVSDSTKVDKDNNDLIKVITELINGTGAESEQETVTASDTKDTKDTEGDATAENTGAASTGGYSSKSVSFRPFKKRRTVKKRRGRK